MYLIRHGEVANASEPVFNGHHDVELSPRGLKQISKVADLLSATTLNAVYGSDLIRAKKGAEIIAQAQGLAPIICPELREVNMGLWGGMTVREIEEKYPGEMEQRRHTLESYRPEGGETFLELQKRILPKFEAIVKQHAGETLAIVAHGGVNRVILGQILDYPLNQVKKLEQDFAAVNIIQFRGGQAAVELINGPCGPLP